MFILVMFQMLALLVMVLLGVAIFSLAERKVMGLIQSRLGPSKVGIGGIMQPFSDAMKLLLKQNPAPFESVQVLYYLSPILFLEISMLCWMSLPVYYEITNFQSSGLFLLFCFSLSVYGLIFSGWFSNSKYASLGSVRSVAQMISYEILLTFSIFFFLILGGSASLKCLDLLNMSFPLVFPLLPLVSISFLSFLAESNRTPFDLPEGESELVGGFSIEYGGISYTLIFLSENSALLFSSVLFVNLFWGPGTVGMGVMIMVLMFLIVWIRATLPRIRWDSMMSLCWIKLLPMQLALTSLYLVLSL
nr:NADH dehydrogenase subunit 1 [Craspedonirmus immer]